jgi:probable phosphoglycerate mutase
MAVYLIRHGETRWSLDHRHTSTTDLPLTTIGEEQARGLRRRLVGMEFSRVLSSPMQRALRTAELSEVQPPAELTPLLGEFDYGEYEGITVVEIRRSRPDWDLWRDGCPGGETPQQVFERSRRLLEELDPDPDRNYAIFTHGHLLRALTVAYLGASLDLCRHLLVQVASISILSHEQELPAIESWDVT